MGGFSNAGVIERKYSVAAGRFTPNSMRSVAASGFGLQPTVPVSLTKECMTPCFRVPGLFLSRVLHVNALHEDFAVLNVQKMEQNYVELRCIQKELNLSKHDHLSNKSDMFSKETVSLGCTNGLGECRPYKKEKQIK